MCYSRLITIMVLAIVFGRANNVSGTEEGKSTETSIGTRRTLSENLPGQVGHLFKWPDLKLIPPEKLMAGNENKHTLRARRNSIEWVKKVVDPNWLPDDPNYFNNNIIMIQNEYGPIDATHIRWNRSGYIIEVTQTMTVFAVKLTPLETATMADTTAAKKERVRRICLNIINEYVDIEVVGPVSSQIIRKNIRPVLLEASFDKASIQNFDDGVHSWCKAPDTTSQSDQADFNYWWRRINWWTDGKIVGIYTLKTEGGAWEAGYSAGMDNNWFEGPE